MRVMLLPNEPPEHSWFTQTGPRDAFRHLEQQGQISKLNVYSFMRERAAAGSQQSFEAALLAEVAKFRPDILFLQHVGSYEFSDAVWDKVKSTGTLVVYHEGDAFGLPLKRPSANLVRVLKAAHLVFTCALGAQRRLFYRVGARRVEYLPHFVDTEIFDTPLALAAEKTCDVIQVGNHGRFINFPPIYFPGGKSRETLARLMRMRFGDRFELYGRGWPGDIGSAGNLPFFDQTRVIRRSWISVNWDHFDSHAYYFSDRLPISLFAGVPHVTNTHPGYAELFAGCTGLYHCNTLTDVADCATWLLSRPRHQLLEEGEAAKIWAASNLSARVVFGGALSCAIEEHKRLALCGS